MKNNTFKKSMMFILAIVMVVGCALSLTGCGKQETRETQVEQSFKGSEWVATTIYDSNGNLYESDFTYTLRFMNESQIEIAPDLYIEGYVYGSSQGIYQYEINNGSLILKDSLLADAPEVVNFSENVIELRSVQDSGSLFHFERADALQDGENTTSVDSEANANVSQLASTVWAASRDDVDFEQRIEFYSDNECFIGRLAEGNWIAVEACTYRFTDGELTIESGMLLNASLDGDYISATTSGDGLLWTFRISDSPLTTEATREALLRTVYQSGVNDDSDLTENNEEAQEQPSVTGDIEWLDFYNETTTGNGYELNEHLHISKWISAGDTATIETAWAEVGKGHEFPSETQLGYGTHGSGTYSTVDGFVRLDYDGMYYAIGYLEVTNETEGFDIDSNNTLTYNLGLTMLTKFEPCHLLLSYSDSNHVYYCHYGSMLDGTRNSIYFTMKSNHWGTVPIVLALPVDRTPNYPDGNPSPAEATFMFGGTEFTLE